MTINLLLPRLSLDLSRMVVFFLFIILIISSMNIVIIITNNSNTSLTIPSLSILIQQHYLQSPSHYYYFYLDNNNNYDYYHYCSYDHNHESSVTKFLSSTTCTIVLLTVHTVTAINPICTKVWFINASEALIGKTRRSTLTITTLSPSQKYIPSYFLERSEDL